jgi:hypothetical protein
MPCKIETAIRASFYFDPPSHGISTLLPMVFWPPYPWYFDPLSMVYWTTYPWYIHPLSMVFWLPYTCYFDCPKHAILTPLPMVYRPPLPMVFWPLYLWYIDPLPMIFGPPSIFWLEMRGVKIPYDTGNQVKKLQNFYAIEISHNWVLIILFNMFSSFLILLSW